uniref:Uncharacterized protein n=1 Tax=Romanomermis culicivorax TaxID=13658 RepID=A0A915K9L5_ROMCU
MALAFAMNSRTVVLIFCKILGGNCFNFSRGSLRFTFDLAKILSPKRPVKEGIKSGANLGLVPKRDRPQSKTGVKVRHSLSAKSSTIYKEA